MGAKEGRDPGPDPEGAGIGPSRAVAPRVMGEANGAGEKGRRRKALLPHPSAQSPLAGPAEGGARRALSERGALENCAALSGLSGLPWPRRFRAALQGGGVECLGARCPGCPHCPERPFPRAHGRKGSRVEQSVLFAFRLRVTPRVAIGSAVSNVIRHEPLEGGPGSGRRQRPPLRKLLPRFAWSPPAEQSFAAPFWNKGFDFSSKRGSSPAPAVAAPTSRRSVDNREC